MRCYITVVHASHSNLHELINIILQRFLMRSDGMRVRLCVRVLDGGGGGSLLETDAGAGELELDELARLSGVVAQRQRQLLQVELKVVGFVLWCQWQTDRQQVCTTVSAVGA